MGEIARMISIILAGIIGGTTNENPKRAKFRLTYHAAIHRRGGLFHRRAL